MNKKRLLVLFLLADAVLGPIILSGMCSTKEPLDPAKFGLVEGRTALADPVADSRAAASFAPASLDMCALLDLGGQFGAVQAASLDELQIVTDAMYGEEDAPLAGSECKP